MSKGRRHKRYQDRTRQRRYGNPQLKRFSVATRRAVERKQVTELKQGADPDAVNMPTKQAEVGDIWAWD